MVRVNRSTLSPDSGTCGRPPAIRLTAFNAQPPNLPPALLMDVDFAAIGQLVQRRRPHIRFLSIGSRLCSTLPSDPASRRQPLRFAITSPPSGCEEDFHLQAVIHARRTNKQRPLSNGGLYRAQIQFPPVTRAANKVAPRPISPRPSVSLEISVAFFVQSCIVEFVQTKETRHEWDEVTGSGNSVP
jgi:hypothetical protein